MRNRLRLPALAAAVIIVVSACASSATSAPGSASAPTTAPASAAAQPSGAPASAATQGVDDGTQITMWSRAATQARAQALVDAYNASHKNHVNMTVVPTDDYQTKVGTAASSNALPDLFSADVVFMPNWTSQGLFQDITSRIAGLPYAAQIAPSAIKVSTWQGKQYGLPFVVDLSVWMYNKKLFTQAGLDPNKAPASLHDFVTDAEAVGKLGGGVHGTFFGGDCGGCLVFTWWPSIWADGQQVMSDDGNTSMLNSSEAKNVYAQFKTMVGDGTVLLPDSKTETGPTWTSYFPKGNIGIMPMPASLQGLATATLQDSDIGVAAISGLSGGQSTFVGGDAIGISKDSKVPDAAWNFLAWLESQDAQVNVVAKGGNVVSRTDLATNQYTASDPRLVLFNTVAGKGETPFALNFGQTYNDPQGPWLPLVRDAVFGDASKIDADNDAINKSLKP